MSDGIPKAEPKSGQPSLMEVTVIRWIPHSQKVLVDSSLTERNRRRTALQQARKRPQSFVYNSEIETKDEVL